MGTDRFFEQPGARLRLRVDGGGRAVLLLHGWALDLEQWEPQVGELGSDRRLIRFDRRGFGLSTGAPALDADVRDALALLDHLGERRAALVGSSQGARVALRVALAAPGRVERVVLDGPPNELRQAPAPEGAPVAPELPLEQYRELARAGRIEEVRRRWSQHPFTRLSTPDAAAQARLDRMLGRYTGQDLLQPSTDAAVLGRAELRRVQAPVLIVGGEHDLPSRLAAGAALAEALPRAERLVLPGAGHLPNLDAPAAYARALREFLDRPLPGR